MRCKLLPPSLSALSNMSASGDALSTQMDQLQMTDAVKTHDDAAMEETASASPHVHAHSHSHALARRILTKEDLAAFETSDAYNAIIDFVARLADSVRNTTLAGNAVPTEPARRLASLVDQLAAWIADFPADAVGQSRFGNPNFRGWLSRVRDEGKELMKDTLGLPETTGMEEAAEYLGNSFGSIQRIDYGTGHELHFICFLLVSASS